MDLTAYLNREAKLGPGGGGYKFVDALKRHMPFTNVNDGASADVIYLLGLSDEDHHHGASQLCFDNPKKRLVLRVNDCDARKNTSHVDRQLDSLSERVSETIFVSQWMKNYFSDRKTWKCKNNRVVINGVDRSIFKPSNKLNNGKTNIVCAHWSDNHLKGADYIEMCDDFVRKNTDYTFTFIGRTRVKLHNSNHIPPLMAGELGLELAKYDVCINASRFDPGPNSVIESISCGVPTYVHVDGGGGREFAGEDHVFSSFEDVEKLLLKREFVKNTDVFMDWKTCITEFCKFVV